jgi:hypothetical protein
MKHHSESAAVYIRLTNVWINCRESRCAFLTLYRR